MKKIENVKCKIQNTKFWISEILNSFSFFKKKSKVQNSEFKTEIVNF